MVRIRIEQFSPKLGLLRDNLAAHGEKIVSASTDGVDVLIFPELSLTGYLVKDLVPEVSLSPDRLLEELHQAAPGASNLEAAVGFVEESAGHRFYNAVAWVRWDGRGNPEILHIHRKVYLPTYGLFDEGRYFSAGRTVRAFDSPTLGRIGMLICEDAFHLSPALLLSIDGHEREGAGGLVVLSNSPARGIEDETQGIPKSHRVWLSILNSYSCLLGTAVIYGNRGGVEDGLIFSGGSCILAPGGRMLVEADLFEPDRIEAKLDWPHLLREYRIGNPGTVSENTELIRRELQRILKSPIED